MSPQIPKSKLQKQSEAAAFPTGMNVICEVYACQNPASYMIGRPDGPLNICFNICDKHMEEVKKSLGIEKELIDMDKAMERLDQIVAADNGWHKFPISNKRLRAQKGFMEAVKATVLGEELEDEDDE